MANRRYSKDAVQEPLDDGQKPAGQLTDGTPYEQANPGDLLSMDFSTRMRLEKFCSKAVESWLASAAAHHENLRRWNDLLEGLSEETDFPWHGASNLHVPLVGIHCVTLHSVMSRSLLTVDPLWYVGSLDTEIREHAVEIEEALNYKTKSELNILEAEREVLTNTVRDGIGWMQLVWSHESEMVETVVRVRSVQEFQTNFPDAESAGLSDGEYTQTLRKIEATASEEAPYEVQVSMERVDYHGPKAFVVDEADMVRAPMTATTLKNCRAYGKRYYARKEEIRKLGEDGKLWRRAAENWCAMGKGGTKDDPWRRALESIEGIAEDNQSFSDERELYSLVARFPMQKGRDECKLLVTYSHEQKRVLGVAKYPYTKDCYTPRRLIRRPGRMIGISIPERLEDMNESVDDSVNYEINSNYIEMAPVFKGKKTAQKDFDPDLEENWIRPAVILWLEDPKEFDQLKIQASDKNAAKLMRQELMRYAEMYIGPTQLLSGRESPMDPDAPGNKTIALIQQSNMRIEDYINEYRLGFEEMGNFIVALYYQFGDDNLDYVNKDNSVDSVRKDIFRKEPKFRAHGVTANLSPEVEFQKAVQWWGLLQGEPMVGGDPMRRRELLNMVMVSGRLPNRQALLPPKPEVEEMQQKQLEKEAEARVIEKLIKAGVIPPPLPVTMNTGAGPLGFPTPPPTLPSGFGGGAAQPSLALNGSAPNSNA